MKLALDPQMFYSTRNHLTPNGLRYITNPPGHTSRVNLASVGFDGVISSCVFGWEEDARGVSQRQRDKALALIGKHFGHDTSAALQSGTTSR